MRSAAATRHPAGESSTKCDAILNRVAVRHCGVRPREPRTRCPRPGARVRQRHREGDGEAAASGADVDDVCAAGAQAVASRASSTISSVSGRGVRTSDVTSKSRPQNSRSPDDLGDRFPRGAAGNRAPRGGARIPLAARRGCGTAARRDPSRARGARAPPRRAWRRRPLMPAPSSARRAFGDALVQGASVVIGASSRRSPWLRP